MNKALLSKAQDLYQRCEAGEPDACYSIMGSGWENLLMGSPITETESSNLMRTAGMAEGGEALLMPEVEMEDDTFLPLMDILGEEKYSELQEAMATFPVVEEVAMMATKTSDGYVEGMGGPKDDVVPARLSDGEFVFSAEAVDVIGLEELERMHEEAKAIAASK